MLYARLDKTGSRVICGHGTCGGQLLTVRDIRAAPFPERVASRGPECLPEIGNLALLIESEFFSKESPTATFTGKYGYGAGDVQGLRVEEHVQRIGEQLLPLLDRANRLMLRNLKALKGLREGPVPSVSIGSAGQVNVAQTQVNEAMGGSIRRTHRLDG